MMPVDADLVSLPVEDRGCLVEGMCLRRRVGSWTSKSKISRASLGQKKALLLEDTSFRRRFDGAEVQPSAPRKKVKVRRRKEDGFRKARPKKRSEDQALEPTQVE